MIKSLKIHPRTYYSGHGNINPLEKKYLNTQKKKNEQSGEGHKTWEINITKTNKSTNNQTLPPNFKQQQQKQKYLYII